MKTGTVGCVTNTFDTSSKGAAIPRFTPPPLTPDGPQGELRMAQDTSGAPVGTTTVIPGEIAARIDRLPMSFMAWEICLLIQIGWLNPAPTDGHARPAFSLIFL